MVDPLCTACAHPNPPGSRFCEDCGADLGSSYCTCPACGRVGRPGARHCTACGARNPRPPAPDECLCCRARFRPGDRFCAACGASLVSGQEGAPRLAGPAVPRVEALPEAPADEERKLVTVLFADVSGFTAMSEKLDPEQVRDIMDRCFEALTREITSRGGTIDKYIGDAVMAYFGVPVAHEDDAPQSVRAALGMQEALRRFVNDLEQQHGLSLAMRIGLNTGKVLAGLVGGEGHKDFTIYGDTVNTASRLEHAAQVGTVLISHDTYLAVRGWFELLELEPIKVKGKERPLQVYRVVQERLRPSALGMRGIEGVDVPMVGRDVELRVVLEWFAEVQREGRAHIVTATGQAGIGKSRLVAEASLRWARELGDLVIIKGRALPPGSGAPLRMVRDLIDDLLFEGEPGRDGVAAAAHAAGVDATDAAALEAILGGDDAHVASAQERELLLRRAFRGLRRLIERRAGTGRAILICEDVHWAPDTLLDFIDHLGASLELPVLVLALSRPELFDRRPLWTEAKPHLHRVDLRPLSELAAQELLALILHRVPSVPPELVDMIVARAGGNPFFLEEIVKVLLETGVLRRGATPEEPWALDASWRDHLDIPASIQGLLQSRVDALPREEKLVLQRAAIFGRTFWAAGVGRLMGRDVSAELASLRSRELLVAREASAFHGEQELVFRNSLLHEVVYDRILHRDRRALHEAAGAWLEEVAGGRAEAERLPSFALHKERAGRPIEAITAYLRAGEGARAQFANPEARDLYRRAVDLLAEPATGEAVSPATKAALFGALGEVCDLSAAYDDALAAYDQALAYAAEAGATATERAELRCGTADVQVRRGDLDAAEREATRALDLAVGAAGCRARALELLGRVCFYRGEYGPAEARCREALAVLTDERMRAGTLRTLSMVHIRRGELDASQQDVTDGLAAAERLGDEMLLGRLTLMQGNIYNLRGQADAAIAEYDRARKSSERLGDLHTARMCHNNMGELLKDLGRWEEARDPLQRSITLCNVLGVRNQVSDTHRLLGEVHLHFGDVAAARREGEAALSLAEETGERSFAAEALRFLGQVALREGGPGALDRAEEYLSRAAAVLGEMGSDVLLGKCLYHFALTLLEAPANGLEPEYRARARKHLTRARDLFDKLGMEGDRSRAEQALRGAVSG